MSSRIERNLRRKRRIRFKIKSKLNGDKKRLSLTKTNRHLYAQLIDDTILHTVIAASTQESLFREQYDGSLNKSNRDSAKILAKIFADRAKNKQITSSIVFDRGCHRYCGVVKDFVESLREHGLEI